MQKVLEIGEKTCGSMGDVSFKRKIGSTVYTVSINFSRTSRITIEDKILRLIESEVMKTA
jgi:hypothetical protein